MTVKHGLVNAGANNKGALLRHNTFTGNVQGDVADYWNGIPEVYLDDEVPLVCGDVRWLTRQFDESRRDGFTNDEGLGFQSSALECTQDDPNWDSIGDVRRWFQPRNCGLVKGSIESCPTDPSDPTQPQQVTATKEGVPGLFSNTVYRWDGVETSAEEDIDTGGYPNCHTDVDGVCDYEIGELCNSSLGACPGTVPGP